MSHKAGLCGAGGVLTRLLHIADGTLGRGRSGNAILDSPYGVYNDEMRVPSTRGQKVIITTVSHFPGQYETTRVV